MTNRVGDATNGQRITSWPERIVAGVVAVVVLVLGLAFGAVILGLAAAVALVLGARLWWWRRRLRREAARRGDTVIEGEYRVLERRDSLRRGGRGNS